MTGTSTPLARMRQDPIFSSIRGIVRRNTACSIIVETDRSTLLAIDTRAGLVKVSAMFASSVAPVFEKQRKPSRYIPRVVGIANA